jgi:hypothetical protein
MQLRYGEIGVSPTGQRHRLSADDLIALTNHHSGQPGARAADTTTVVDREEELATYLPRERDHTVVGSHDDGGYLCADVDTTMTGGVRIVRRVEPTHDRPHDRPRPRHRASRHRRHGRDARESKNDDTGHPTHDAFDLRADGVLRS